MEVIMMSNLQRRLVQYDMEKLKNDIECLYTVEEELRMVDDEMTL